jgi:diaminohydroxyphosphoribosylaminopyrimidine deaminase/5-amino-6-(5-phosphoribosylamino)uracil reductase
VAKGLLEDDARELNPGFFSRLERQRPWVRLKLGASLDGRTALANGASRWITSKPARADAQLYRARSSVVLTGIGTVLTDDPALNVRLEGASRQPLRVVLDSTLRAPPGARMFNREGSALILVSKELSDVEARAEPYRKQGVEIETVAPAAGGGLHLPAVLARLAALEANEVWVEAGARLAGAFLAQRLVDELVLYVAPCLLGSGAMPLAQLPQLTDLDQRLALRYHEVTRVGADLRLVLRPENLS